MRLVDCTLQRHGQAVLDILNDAIVHSTALYDYQPRTMEQMAGWFAAKQAGAYPVIGLEDEAGALLGFASYGPFRAYAAFKYTVEHSVYLRRDARGRGLGLLLLQALIARARTQQLHVLVGAIDADNAASIALHRRLGFVHGGTLRQVGFKFGRWLDLALYQLVLPTPAQPCEG